MANLLFMNFTIPSQFLKQVYNLYSKRDNGYYLLFNLWSSQLDKFKYDLLLVGDKLWLILLGDNFMIMMSSKRNSGKWSQTDIETLWVKIDNIKFVFKKWAENKLSKIDLSFYTLPLTFINAWHFQR